MSRENWRRHPAEKKTHPEASRGQKDSSRAKGRPRVSIADKAPWWNSTPDCGRPAEKAPARGPAGTFSNLIQ